MSIAQLPLAEISAAFANTLSQITPIAIGGQAAVYSAIRQRNQAGLDTGDAVALKIYLDVNENQRVEREVQVAASMSSDCLCGLLDHGTVKVQNQFYRYLIWTYIEGESLESSIKRAAVPPSLACVIGRDVSKAIQAIWDKRIVHRDVNPKNIMVRKGLERAVLIDLGVAKHLEQSPLTAAGLTWGTTGYLSPEQMLGMPLTCQSDVFSLGVTLQEALGAKHPTGRDQRSLASGGPPTHTVAPNTPAILAALIDRMVNNRPARRPAPNELTDSFANFLEELT